MFCFAHAPPAVVRGYAHDRGDVHHLWGRKQSALCVDVCASVSVPCMLRGGMRGGSCGSAVARRGPPRWGRDLIAQTCPGRTPSLRRRPDRAAGHSGKRGHARRRGSWEAARAAALGVEARCGGSLLTSSAGRCGSRRVFTLSYLIMAPVDLAPCPGSVIPL